MMRISMYDLEGNLLEVFETDSIVNLEKKLKLSQSSLNGCLSGRLNKTDNKQFRLVNGNIVLNKIGDISRVNGTNHLKSIIKLYNKKFICSYSSLIEANYKTNIDMGNITRCLKGTQKTAGGFNWIYADNIKI